MADPTLPRHPDDPENLRRLREEAQRRLDREEAESPVDRTPRPPFPAPAYGGPPVGPAPVYGGPPILDRRSIFARALSVVIAILAAVWGWFYFWGRKERPVAVPAYGAPPQTGLQ